MRLRLILAVVVLAILAVAVARFGHRGYFPPARALPIHASTASLGAALMNRVGEDFVLDSRQHSQMQKGITFYGRPKAQDRWLCRVKIYTFPTISTSGKTGWSTDADDLSVATEYFYLRPPTESKISYHEAQAACAASRHFDDRFHDNGNDAARHASYELDVLLHQAAAANPPLKISCKDFRWEIDPKPCDGLAVLRSLKLRKLREVDGESVLLGIDEAFYKDMLYFERKDDFCDGETGLHMDSHVFSQNERDRFSVELYLNC
jgi:hypothetical protein